MSDSAEVKKTDSDGSKEKPLTKKQALSKGIEILPPRELKKAVEAIHISGKLTLSQKKIFNNLVYYAFDEIGTKEEHKASVSKLIQDTEFDSRNIKALRDSLKAIMRTLMELDVLGSGAEKGWKGVSLLSEAEISDGVVTYVFPRTLRAVLDNPKVFAMINLRIQNLFTSAYSLNLYENCFRFKDSGSTGWRDIDTWRKLLGAEDDTYKEFKFFNGFVIKPSVLEVNRLSDILVEPEFEKKGRSVVSMRFVITEKKGAALAVTNMLDPNKVEVMQSMMKIGITEKAARDYLEAHPLEYVAGNLGKV